MKLRTYLLFDLELQTLSMSKKDLMVITPVKAMFEVLEIETSCDDGTSSHDLQTYNKKL